MPSFLREHLQKTEQMYIVQCGSSNQISYQKNRLDNIWKRVHGEEKAKVLLQFAIMPETIFQFRSNFNFNLLSMVAVLKKCDEKNLISKVLYAVGKKSKTSDISMLIRIQLSQINQFCTQCDDKFTTIIQLFAFFVRAIVHLKCQYAYAVCNFNSGIYVQLWFYVCQQHSIVESNN